MGFFVVQGGVGWDALLAGPTGDHALMKANVIAGEVAAASAENRPAVLARFAAAYKVDFVLLRGEEVAVSTTKLELPAAVKARTEMRFMRRGTMVVRGERGDGAPSAEVRPPPGEFDPSRHPEPGEFGPPRGDFGSGRGEPGGAPPRGEVMWDPARERERTRFIIHSASPAGYWVGLRVPFSVFDRGRFRGPATLIARVDSLWSLLRYLELQSWLLAGTGVIALSVLFWLPLVHSITRSIGQLTSATEQIAEGRFDTRVDARRRDELGKLGESVNRMAERLDAHMTGQKRFLGDVAHELCSPLARLQMATGILSDQANSELKETVTDVRDEVQQMSTLVNELLAFTKSGLKPRDVVCSPLELEPLAREVVAREDTAGRTVVAIPVELRAHAERDLLSRALGNLIRNAVRYAPSGPIAIGAARDGAQVVISVEDEGPGVPPADLDRLGEPFYRPELARTRESGGVGLGLAIVRNSIAACGGEVRFANRSPRGFRAEIRLAAA
jgi:two-component system sensor histidine kinase CpxA